MDRRREKTLNIKNQKLYFYLLKNNSMSKCVEEYIQDIKNLIKKYLEIKESARKCLNSIILSTNKDLLYLDNIWDLVDKNMTTREELENSSNIDSAKIDFGKYEITKNNIKSMDIYTIYNNSEIIVKSLKNKRKEDFTNIINNLESKYVNDKRNYIFAHTIENSDKDIVPILVYSEDNRNYDIIIVRSYNWNCFKGKNLPISIYEENSNLVIFSNDKRLGDFSEKTLSDLKKQIQDKISFYKKYQRSIKQKFSDDILLKSLLDA
jgi:hypothetical protein